MKLKIQVTKCIGKYPNRQILGCVPMDFDVDVILSKYGNFTLIDEMLVLSEGKIYTVEMEETESKYGKQYKLISVPSFSIQSVETITDEMEYELLSEITSGSIINSIHDAYPDYLRLILQGRQDEIDLKKIKGVKEYRHNLYCRLINEKFKYYHILESNKQYKLELKDCKALANIYSTVEKINEMMQENPYYCLVYICGRDFLNADKVIMECRHDLVDSDIRTEFAMIYLLKLNEQEGHTYIDAKEIGNKMLPFGLEVVRKLKDVAVDSELIYYNEVENTLALTNTYLAECRIVEFVKDKLNNSTKLEDWDWHKFTKIKDGELTDEQSYVLKNFCENNITILNAIGGSGKSSSMLALLDMCDFYHKSYTLLSPTGRASKRLAEQSFRPASTIHRGTGMGTKDIYSDVIIADESSMITIETMLMIINSVKNPNARFVFLLDTNQLPPIGLGYVLREIIDSKIMDICSLTRVFRFGEGGLSYATTLSTKGKHYLPDDIETQTSATLGKNKDYKFIKTENDPNQILDIYIDFINKGVNPSDIAVITPRNTGEYGTYALNNLIQNEINPPKPNEMIMEYKVKYNNIEYPIVFRVGDLVLVTKNDYNMINEETYQLLEFEDDITIEDVEKVSIFNGEIGEVLYIGKSIMKVKIDNEIIIFNKSNIYNLVLGYVLTTFKLQGSEVFYGIVLTLNQHKNQLNKNLLYTSLSRGRKQVVEVGDLDANKYSLATDGDKRFRCNIGKMLKNNS